MSTTNPPLTSVKDYVAGHPAVDGHFAGRPIIPGVVILTDVLASIQQLAGAIPAMIEASYSLRAAKFLHPVLPGQQMTVVLRVGEKRAIEPEVASEMKLAAGQDTARAQISIHFDCSVGNTAVARGTFEFSLDHG